MATTDYREVLESKRLEITENLNCARTYLFDYLRCKRVFDQEDIELIMAEKTSKSRAGKFVDALILKGTEGFQHFLDVVQVENASLYESLTGQSASNNPSPLIKHTTEAEVNNSGVCFFGLGMLADHQQRLYAELQEVHRHYSALLSANQELEGRLVKANKDLELEKERRVQYEKTFSHAMEDKDENIREETLFLHECDELQKGLADRDVYIIVLQMKLLAEKEECDNLRSKVSELQHKTETMDRELRRMSESYNHERSQSLKLSECIRLQGEEVQKLDILKHRLRDSQFQNILAQEERDSATEELDELKKWAEALKTRFDVIEKEKYDCLEKNEFVTSNCVNLKESIRTLRRQISLTNFESEDLKKRNEMLTKDCEVYKKQRDCALDARKEAILERDKMAAEKDRFQRQCTELQQKRDQMNEDRAQLIQDYDHLKRCYAETLDDLSQLKQKLNEKEMEVGDLTMKLKEVEDKYRRNSCLLNMNIMPTTMESEKGAEDTAPEVPRSNTGTPADNENEDTSGGAPWNGSRWRDRKLKALLNSMKLRISGVRNLEDIAKDPVSPASENMTLQVLQCLLPNLNSRPYASPPTGRRVGATSMTRTLERQLAIKRPCDVSKDDVDDAIAKASTFPNRRSKSLDGCVETEGAASDWLSVASAAVTTAAAAATTTATTTQRAQQALSAPNISHLGCDELDRLPERFRDRTTTVICRVQRSFSDVQ